MNKCPDCGAIIPEGSRFCPSCGKKLFKNCPNCGKEISIEQNFCNSCGQDNTPKGVESFVEEKRIKKEVKLTTLNKIWACFGIVALILVLAQGCAVVGDNAKFEGMYYSAVIINQKTEYYLGCRYAGGVMRYAFFDLSGNMLRSSDVKYCNDFQNMLADGTEMTYSMKDGVKLALYSPLRNPAWMDIPVVIQERIANNIGFSGTILEVESVFRPFYDFDYAKLKPKYAKKNSMFVFAVNEL